MWLHVKLLLCVLSALQCFRLMKVKTWGSVSILGVNFRLVLLCMIILLPYRWGIFFSNFEELHGTCQNHDQWMFYIGSQPQFPSWGLDGYRYSLLWWPVCTENHHNCIGSGFAEVLTEVHQGRGIYHPTLQPLSVHQTGFPLWGLVLIYRRKKE